MTHLSLCSLLEHPLTAGDLHVAHEVHAEDEPRQVAAEVRRVARDVVGLGQRGGHEVHGDQQQQHEEPGQAPPANKTERKARSLKQKPIEMHRKS